jgi:hypothetical protein
MITEIDPTRIRWHGEGFAIYDIADFLPHHPNYPHGTNSIDPNTGKRSVAGSYSNIPNRKITTIVCHQTAGGYGAANKQVFETASFFVRDPAFKPNPRFNQDLPAGLKNMRFLWTGTGRGWPGFAYTWFVPFKPIIWVDPDTDTELYLIYQCNDLNTISWHTGDHQNDIGGGIAFQGYFLEPDAGIIHPMKGTDGSPSEAQLQIYEGFWSAYAQPVLGATILTIHAEHGKPSCPGQVLREKTLELRS